MMHYLIKRILTLLSMYKREADFGVLFRHWLKANPGMSCAYELKQTASDSLPFSSLEQHQEDYLMAIRSDKGVLIRVQDTNGEPDYIYLRNFPARVVVKFKNGFELIDIQTWVLEKKRSHRKSLTHARAKQISTISIRYPHPRLASNVRLVIRDLAE